jgi:hypothetical protein
MLPKAVATVAKARGDVPPERWRWHHVFECAYRWHAANGDWPVKPPLPIELSSEDEPASAIRPVNP